MSVTLPTRPLSLHEETLVLKWEYTKRSPGARKDPQTKLEAGKRLGLI